MLYDSLTEKSYSLKFIIRFQAFYSHLVIFIILGVNEHFVVFLMVIVEIAKGGTRLCNQERANASINSSGACKCGCC